METWYPAAVRRPITTNEYFNPRDRDLISVCDHITDGTDSRDMLQHSDNGSSVHFLIRDEAGGTVVYQFMPIEWAAYSNGIWSENNVYMPQWIRALLPALRAGTDNINRYTVSIEHERKYPFYTLPSASMIAASIALHQWLASTVPTIIRDREHIIGHYQIDNVRKANCPGGPGGHLFTFAQILDALEQGPQGPVSYTPPGAQFSLIGAFKDYYLAEPKALQYFGLPITGERPERLGDGNTYTVQYFERARFEWHPPSVLLGLLGVEHLAGH